MVNSPQSMQWAKRSNKMLWLMVAFALGVIAIQQQYLGRSFTIVAVIGLDFLCAFGFYRHMLSAPHSLKSTLMGFGYAFILVGFADIFIALTKNYYNFAPDIFPFYDVLYLSAAVVSFYYTIKLPLLMEKLGLYSSKHSRAVLVISFLGSVFLSSYLGYLKNLPSILVFYHFNVIFLGISFGLQALWIQQGKIGTRIRNVSITLAILNIARVIAAIGDWGHTYHLLYTVLFSLSVWYLLSQVEEW